MKNRIFFYLFIYRTDDNQDSLKNAFFLLPQIAQQQPHNEAAERILHWSGVSTIFVSTASGSGSISATQPGNGQLGLVLCPICS